MKKFLLFLTLLLLDFEIYSQNVEWIRQIGGDDDNKGSAIVDEENNIWIMGKFYHKCYFTKDTLETDYSTGDAFFYSRYDSTGQEIFAKKIVSDLDYEARGKIIGIDNKNRCFYLTGDYDHDLTINGITINDWFSSNFLGKFNFSGKCLWLKKMGTNTINYTDITINADGSFYCIGYAREDDDIIDNITIKKGAFLSKFDNSGKLLWLKKTVKGGAINDIKHYKDYLLITGTSNELTLIIDTLQLNSTNNRRQNSFVAFLDLNGKVIKAKRCKSRDFAGGLCVESDKNKNIFLLGYIMYPILRTDII